MRTVIVLSIALSAQLVSPQIDFATLSKRWQGAMAPFTVPGMALVVVQGDKVIFEGAFGYADAAQKRPVNLDTMFYIASVTKTMTGLATALNVADGRMKWEQRVSDYFPKFRLKDGPVELTMNDLVSHSKGLQVPGLVDQDAYTGEITQGRYDWWLQNTGFVTGQTNYANEHFTLLGRVLEKVHAKPWQDVLQSQVFNRLGMSRSTAYASRLYGDSNSAQPLFRDGTKFSLVSSVKTDRIMHAAGGVGSTANDMSRYLRALLNDGVLDGKQVLPKGLTADVFRRRSDTPSNGSIRIRNGFGVGWNLGSYRKLTPLLTHGGGYAGTLASVAMLPEKNIGFALLINGQDAAGALEPVCMVDIFDRLLGLEPEDLLPGYLKQAEMASQRTPRSVPTGSNPAFGGLSLPVWSYAGTYLHKQAGTLTFWVEGGLLKCRMGDYTLHPVSTKKDTLSLLDGVNLSELTPASFLLNGARVVGIKAKLGGIEFTFKRK